MIKVLSVQTLGALHGLELFFAVHAQLVNLHKVSTKVSDAQYWQHVFGPLPACTKFPHGIPQLS